jgi:hypothetical protein
MPATTTIEIRVGDKEPVVAALKAAGNLAKAATIHEFNPCTCEQCARYAREAMLKALSEWREAMRAIPQ